MDTQTQKFLDRIAAKMIEFGEFDIEKAGMAVIEDDRRIATTVVKAKVSADDGFMLTDPRMAEFITGMAKRVYVKLKH